MNVAVAERLRQAYPTLLEWAGMGSIPANSDAQNVPSFRRWRFEMKLSPLNWWCVCLCQCLCVCVLVITERHINVYAHSFLKASNNSNLDCDWGFCSSRGLFICVCVLPHHLQDSEER